jgi:type III secretory pathway component EscR
MTLQEQKDKADIIAKEAEIVYKKIVVLLAINGAVGGFGLSVFDRSFVIGLLLFVPFAVISFGIVLAYLKLNRLENLIKGLRNE